MPIKVLCVHVRCVIERLCGAQLSLARASRVSSREAARVLRYRYGTPGCCMSSDRTRFRARALGRTQHARAARHIMSKLANSNKLHDKIVLLLIYIFELTLSRRSGRPSSRRACRVDKVPAHRGTRHRTVHRRDRRAYTNETSAGARGTATGAHDGGGRQRRRRHARRSADG